MTTATGPRTLPGGVHADVGGRLHHLAASALQLLQGHVALLQWELLQESARLGSRLRRGLTVCLGILLSAQLLLVLLVALAWDTPWRLHVVGGLLALTVLATLLLIRSYRRQRVEDDSQLFAATLHELAKDREALENFR